MIILHDVLATRSLSTCFLLSLPRRRPLLPRPPYSEAEEQHSHDPLEHWLHSRAQPLFVLQPVIEKDVVVRNSPDTPEK